MLLGAFAEPWARAAAARGIPGRRVARQALRRCAPGLLPNAGPFAVGLTGGSVAVEQIFDIPGLGRGTLLAAVAQDLPVLQAGTLALVLLAATTAALVRPAVGLLTGPALRDGALPPPPAPRPATPRAVPLPYAAVLLGVIALAVPRDPLALDTAARLQRPSWAHPFGTDALGRDVLARVGHGAAGTLTQALLISAAALLAGVLLGLLPRLSGPLVDTVNAVPPVLAGLLVAGAAGAGRATPALAVAAVAWAPLAAHTSALVRQERATPICWRPAAWARDPSSCCAAVCCPQSCRPSPATPCCGCPASPSPWPPWAWAPSRPPPNGDCCSPRTSRTPSGPPGPSSPSSGRWR
jgi:peptide/nickel transport system permease protein